MSTLDNDYRDGALQVLTFAMNGAVIQAKVNTLTDLMHVRVSPWGDTVYRDAVNDTLYLNGILHSTRPVWTTGPACFDYRDGTFLVCYADDLGWLSRFGRDGHFIERFQTHTVADAPSEGLHHVEPDGRIIFGNDPSLIRQVKPGEEKWAGCVETADYIVGAYGQGFLATFHKPTGIIKRWRGHTQSPHFALQTGAELYVFINGAPATPEPNAVPWVLDAEVPPIVNPPQPPSATNDLYLPLPISPLPAARVGCTDGPSELGRRPGNCYWSPTSTDDLSLPVGEGAPYESTMIGRTWLNVKWSTESSAAGTLDASIALAKRLRVSLEIHHDNVQDPAQIGLALAAYDQAKAAGVVPVLQAHAVENVADFEHAARAFSAKDRRFAICVNFRVWGKDPEKFRAVVQKAEQLHRELRPVYIWFVHWKGAGPQMKQYVAEYCRLTPTP